MKRTEDRYFRISLLVLVPWVCLKHPHLCCCTCNYSKMYMQLIFHIICKHQSIPVNDVPSMGSLPLVVGNPFVLSARYQRCPHPR